MMNRLAVLVGIICLILAISQAQTDFAALLQVNFGNVEILRANTTRWIRLPVGAQTPVGAGDAVRTDTFGRAHITFLNGANVLTLPMTTFTLSAFSADPDGLGMVTLAVDGRAIIEVTAPEAFADFRVVAPHLQVVAPADVFAVQSSADATTVIVGRGNATVTNALGSASSAVRLGENVGVRGTQSLSSPIRLSYPATFAQLDGVLDGCIGVVSARRQTNLNVRSGPTLNYDVVGTVENGQVVQLLATAPNGERHRVVYKAGFGWILALEVRTSCTDLPTLPYTTREMLYGVLTPSEAELALLEPFFGLPEADPWFYYGCIEEC